MIRQPFSEVNSRVGYHLNWQGDDRVSLLEHLIPETLARSMMPSTSIHRKQEPTATDERIQMMLRKFQKRSGRKHLETRPPSPICWIDCFTRRSASVRLPN